MKISGLILTALLCLTAFSSAAAADEIVSVLPTEHEERIFAAGGDNELVKCYYKNAIVRIPDEPDAEASIMSALTDAEQRMISDCRNSVKEQEEIMKEYLDGSGEWLPMFTLELRTELNAERISGGVISFRVLDYMYSGGAHGMYGIGGRTFETRTGREISLADLSGQADRLRESCIAEIIRQCLGRENLWFSSEEELRPAITAITDRDSWYLTDEGIVFHSSPYELGPYSEGAIEFTVPYALLPEMKY